MNPFNPNKLLKSRYSTCSVPSNFFGTISISGNTLSGSTLNNNILIGHKVTGMTQGYIYLPYLLAEATPFVMDRWWSIEVLRKERKEKLKKLGWS